MSHSVSVVILSYNCAPTIGRCVDSARRVSDDVVVVDSYSSDGTDLVAAHHGARVVQHPFENYGAQRNWAISTLDLRYEWQLHLDADEVLSDELTQEINELQEKFPAHIDGFLLKRLHVFMGRPLRHGGFFPVWHLRLFRAGKGSCETRLYDQHFLVDGPVQCLNGIMYDYMELSLSEWTARHNRWSDAEAAELTGPVHGRRTIPKIRGTPIQRARALRSVYDAAPLLVRPWLLFLYRYVLRMGFLDGREGLIFWVLQTLWFRFLVDAKIFERRGHAPRASAPSNASALGGEGTRDGPALEA